MFLTNCFLLAVFLREVAARCFFVSDLALAAGRHRCVFLPLGIVPQSPAMFPCVSIRFHFSFLNQLRKFSLTYSLIASKALSSGGKSCGCSSLIKLIKDIFDSAYVGAGLVAPYVCPPNLNFLFFYN